MTELAQIYPDVEVADPYSLEQFPTDPVGIPVASSFTYSRGELLMIALLFAILLVGVVHLYLSHGKSRKR